MITDRSLDLDINERHGIFILKGWSVGVESTPHYEEILFFIKAHLKENDRLTAYFSLDFFDMKSLGYLFQIFKILNASHHEGKKVTVKWSWRSSSSLMKLCGEDFKTLFDLPFEIFED